MLAGEWNTIAEEGAAITRPAQPAARRARGRLFALEPLAGEAHDAPAVASGTPSSTAFTGAASCSRAPGSLSSLLHRQSTLLIQVTATLARAGNRAVYISGEEAVAQCGCAPTAGLGGALSSWPLRRRSKTSSQPWASATPRASSSSTRSDDVDGRRRLRARTVTQVRGAAAALIRFANGPAAVILVVHVTKDVRSPAPGWSSTWSTRCSLRG